MAIIFLFLQVRSRLSVSISFPTKISRKRIIIYYRTAGIICHFDITFSCINNMVIVHKFIYVQPVFSRRLKRAHFIQWLPVKRACPQLHLANGISVLDVRDARVLISDSCTSSPVFGPIVFNTHREGRLTGSSLLINRLRCTNNRLKLRKQ